MTLVSLFHRTDVDTPIALETIVYNTLLEKKQHSYAFYGTENPGKI